MTQRLILVLLLVLSSGPAYAEWVWISFTESDGGYSAYADPDTIRLKGELVKMWVLYDFKTVQLATGLAHLSDSTQLQANCADELLQRLAYTWWSGNMRNGKVIFSHSDEGNWIPVEPGSVGHTLWKFACKKK